MIQVFDLFGVYGLSFVTVFVNVTLKNLIESFLKKRSLPYQEIAFSLLILILTLAYGFWKIGIESKVYAANPSIKVGIVQANIDIFEKSEQNKEYIQGVHRAMSYALNSPNLIIWPETAVQTWIPGSAEFLKDKDKDENKAIVPDINGSYFLVGGLSYDVKMAPGEDPTLDKFNTAFLTTPEGKIIQKYNKVKLLLFGEYLPFSKYIPAIKSFSPASGDFTPGDNLEPMEIPDMGLRIAPLICYEDIIPSISRKLVGQGANLLVNLTNDAWFGKTVEPKQHLIFSVPRAVETRRYLIRATNTGISAVVDPIGRIVSKTKIFERESLEEEVRIIDRETVYMKIGDTFAWVCLALWIGFFVVTGLRPKTKTKSFLKL